MPIYNIAFYSIIFFLFGVLLASFDLNLIIITLIAVLSAILFFVVYLRIKNNYFKEIAFLSLAIIIGAAYYIFWDKGQNKNINILYEKKINFSGIIIDYPEKGEAQKLIIQLQKPLSGKILVNLKSYPEFDYGDLVSFEAVIKKPETGKYADYLAKDLIYGIANFPKTELIAKNQASPIKSFLFKIRKNVAANFQKVLSFEQAAFLAGITIGERAEFSKDFKESLNKSGTTHLVALSGYNITIIVITILPFFSYFLRRNFAFLATIIAVLAFVLMTGAEASVVRAAIMTGIILLAQQVGRLYSVRNAVAAAAFLMVLQNPKILSFDLGFQLSFAALLGIVYLAPMIRKFLKIKEESGFLGWRENFLNTASAQFAVLPLLAINFGGFSIISLISNVLILGFIPLTMIFGFLIGFFGFIFMPLAIILGWFSGLLLSYEIFIIKLFGKIPLLTFKFGILGAIIYYLIIFVFIIFIELKSQK